MRSTTDVRANSLGAGQPGRPHPLPARAVAEQLDERPAEVRQVDDRPRPGRRRGRSALRRWASRPPASRWPAPPRRGSRNPRSRRAGRRPRPGGRRRRAPRRRGGRAPRTPGPRSAGASWVTIRSTASGTGGPDVGGGTPPPAQRRACGRPTCRRRGRWVGPPRDPTAGGTGRVSTPLGITLRTHGSHLRVAGETRPRSVSAASAGQHLGEPEGHHPHLLLGALDGQRLLEARPVDASGRARVRAAATSSSRRRARAGRRIRRSPSAAAGWRTGTCATTR